MLLLVNPVLEEKMVRRPGIEPGPPAWKAGILATELSTHDLEPIPGVPMTIPVTGRPKQNKRLHLGSNQGPIG